MEHELLLLLALKGFQALRIVAGAERAGHQRLRFAACKQGRAVGARQQGGFNRNGADLVKGTAVRPHSILGDLLPEGLLPQQLVVVRKLLLRGGLLGFGQLLDLGLELVLDGLYQRVRLGLGMGVRVKRILQALAHLALQRFKILLVVLEWRQLALRLPGKPNQLVDLSDNLFDLDVGKVDRAQHDVLRHPIRAGLDHHDAVRGAHHRDADRGLLALGIGRVDQVLAPQVANPHRAHRAVERDVRQGKRGRRGIDADDVGVVLLVR